MQIYKNTKIQKYKNHKRTFCNIFNKVSLVLKPIFQIFFVLCLNAISPKTFWGDELSEKARKVL